MDRRFVYLWLNILLRELNVLCTYLTCWSWMMIGNDMFVSIIARLVCPCVRSRDIMSLIVKISSVWYLMLLEKAKLCHLPWKSLMFHEISSNILHKANMDAFTANITVASQWVRWRLKSPASRLFTQSIIRKSKKTAKLRATGLWAGNSPVTGEFPAQRASNAENVSIWWRHHEHGWTSWLYLRSAFAPQLMICRDPLEQD